MCNVEIVTSSTGRVKGVYTWTNGFKTKAAPTKPMTQEDALAYALFLCNHGFVDEADEFIDEFIAGKRWWL